ncbi:uncharacterized protein LOC142586997 [Dermacentor variabilis]|uniref:uncharacterized protein LOC142586997 n=1 Tax=Dermacentor variabilis TaxID=34621 RepID=UPI003F5B8E76
MSSSALPKPLRGSQSYRLLELLVVTILSGTILAISSCTIDCQAEDKPRPLCLRSPDYNVCNCTCVPLDTTCPPLGRTLCDNGQYPSFAGWQPFGGTFVCMVRCSQPAYYVEMPPII